MLVILASQLTIELQQSVRHIVTLEESAAIHKVLMRLSSATQCDPRLPAHIRQLLEDCSKQGCDALILNLRVVKESLDPLTIRGASFVGKVLVVAGMVTTGWLAPIEELGHRRWLPEPPGSRFRAFFHKLF